VRLTPFDHGAGKRAEAAIVVGTVATGDVFVASENMKHQLRETLHADAVEMEGASVAQVCRQRGTPCLVLRSISDLSDENAERDFERFARTAAGNSAMLVTEIIKAIADER
jgi:adenosylhomocysteine nucleosidase